MTIRWGAKAASPFFHGLHSIVVAAREADDVSGNELPCFTIRLLGDETEPFFENGPIHAALPAA
ncbi:hypothetical protein [Geobacillus vulcani]|uniref:hypothetical protein n=1 Tax=Geobacillus vulcani TaxID=135517 RepID=UPI0004DF9C0A|nr:hypothetical protein [Geobacillus vulcani]